MPNPASSRLCSRPPTRSVMSPARGAQTRNSARPSPSGKAPRRRSNGRWVTGTRTASSRAEGCSIEAMRMFLATVLAAFAVAAPTTEPATNVTATGATLNGMVDGPAMDVHFEYDAKTSGAYELATPAQTVTAAGDVSATISNLTPETKYRYRIVASGQTGDERTFDTTANPSPPA